MGRPALMKQTDVIELVMPVFWRQGYGATSIKDIEAVSNQGRSSLYHAFNGKEAIYTACLEHYLESVLEPVFLPFSRGEIPTETFFANLVDFMRDTTHPQGCFIRKGMSEQAVLPPATRTAIINAFAQRLAWVENGVNEAYRDLPSKYRFEIRTLIECFITNAYFISETAVPNAIGLETVQSTLLDSIDTCVAAAGQRGSNSNFSRRRR